MTWINREFKAWSYLSKRDGVRDIPLNQPHNKRCCDNYSSWFMKWFVKCKAFNVCALRFHIVILFFILIFCLYLFIYLISPSFHYNCISLRFSSVYLNISHRLMLPLTSIFSPFTFSKSSLTYHRSLRMLYFTYSICSTHEWIIGRNFVKCKLDE